MAAERKLNIFQVLGALNKKHQNVYQNLSEAEQKEFQPLVLMRWLSGTSDVSQIIMLNEVVNQYVFSLTHHKPLLSNLLSSATSGSVGRVKWVKAKHKKKPNYPVAVNIIQHVYGYNINDAVEVLPILSDDDILAYATEIGTQPEDVKALKRELKSRS